MAVVTAVVAVMVGVGVVATVVAAVVVGEMTRWAQWAAVFVPLTGAASSLNGSRKTSMLKISVFRHAVTVRLRSSGEPRR